MKRNFNARLNTIFLDMDGVLADFEDFVQNISKNYWHRLTWDDLQEERIFLNLEPMPYAHDLVKLSKSLCDNVEILTAIPNGITGRLAHDMEMDKRQWILNHFGGENLKFNIGPRSNDKWRHAYPGDVLVDDLKSNIYEWSTLGQGNAIWHTGNYVETAAKLKDVANIS